MTASEMLSWLRTTIEGDKAAAEKLSGESWTVVTEVVGCYITTSADQAFGRVDEDGGGILDPDEADHMVRHDPRNTLARCEADLAMLNDHLPADANFNMPSVAAWEGHCGGCGYEMPCPTVQTLASGYRHRDGFKPAWLGDR